MATWTIANDVFGIAVWLNTSAGIFYADGNLYSNLFGTRRGTLSGNWVIG